jgi:hypothetical protein
VSDVRTRNVMAKDLPSLPPSSDKDFWQGEVEIIELHEKERCSHSGYLTLRERMAHCINCNAGWNLDGRDRVEDGHLYRDGIKII